MQAIDEYRELAGQDSLLEEALEDAPTLAEQIAAIGEKEREFEEARRRAERRYRRKPYVAPSEPGRNDPCSCGSGEKYKRCCLYAEA